MGFITMKSMPLCTTGCSIHIQQVHSPTLQLAYGTQSLRNFCTKPLDCGRLPPIIHSCRKACSLAVEYCMEVWKANFMPEYKQCTCILTSTNPVHAVYECANRTGSGKQWCAFVMVCTWLPTCLSTSASSHSGVGTKSGTSGQRGLAAAALPANTYLYASVCPKILQNTWQRVKHVAIRNTCAHRASGVIASTLVFRWACNSILT